MELWVLGFIMDKPDENEATNWYLEGLFFTREEAVRTFSRITSRKPESYFVAPVLVGELLYQDIMEMSGFEYIKKKSYLHK